MPSAVAGYVVITKEGGLEVVLLSGDSVPF